MTVFSLLLIFAFSLVLFIIFIDNITYKTLFFVLDFILMAIIARLFIDLS